VKVKVKVKVDSASSLTFLPCPSRYVCMYSTYILRTPLLPVPCWGCLHRIALPLAPPLGPELWLPPQPTETLFAPRLLLDSWRALPFPFQGSRMAATLLFSLALEWIFCAATQPNQRNPAKILLPISAPVQLPWTLLRRNLPYSVVLSPTPFTLSFAPGHSPPACAAAESAGASDRAWGRLPRRSLFFDPGHANQVR
jgi:hypothetical protein